MVTWRRRELCATCGVHVGLCQWLPGTECSWQTAAEWAKLAAAGSARPMWSVQRLLMTRWELEPATDAARSFRSSDQLVNFHFPYSPVVKILPAPWCRTFQA